MQLDVASFTRMYEIKAAGLAWFLDDSSYDDDANLRIQFVHGNESFQYSDRATLEEASLAPDDELTLICNWTLKTLSSISLTKMEFSKGERMGRLSL